MKAAGVTPNAAVSGAAAAITKKTICGTPSASLRRASTGMSEGISVGISDPLEGLDGRPAADLVRHLALQELAVLEVAVEGAVVDDHMAALDGDRGPRRHDMVLPRRVVGLVQVSRLDGLREPGLQQHDVSVGT